MRLTIAMHYIVIILARISSLKIVWIGSVVVGISFFFLDKSTILSFFIAILVIGITGISTGPSDALKVVPFVATCMAAFALPAWAMVWLLRNFASDRIVSILVVAWLACYMYLFMIGPELEGF